MASYQENTKRVLEAPYMQALRPGSQDGGNTTVVAGVGDCNSRLLKMQDGRALGGFGFEMAKPKPSREYEVVQ
ncbi:uncharacterized protein N7473_001189 [Penicillium subrubescens]|uniref:uncharacterized protein n=1 Tax=Penicillium subrubescens TaxID=1316194 RepID=UPI002545A8FF|nr:uncharacterized protein N7473_001189 [Penicillium subrubescens]KAJ5911886.1 hypothetical protein N7473_001189 [Penicillium subrubescens]